MTDRQTEHRPFWEFLIFLLSWHDMPAELTQAAWAAAHPIGGTE